MNTHDIELPPLPEPTYRGPSGTGNYFDGYTKQTLQAYATAAIEADRQTNKNLTHYMPEVIAALKATGCNESLVADIEKSMRGEYDRQARGEPVADYPSLSVDTGMSLRDWFAGLAMQGLLAAQIHGFNDSPANGPFTSMAYEMADAMLKAKEEE